MVRHLVDGIGRIEARPDRPRAYYGKKERRIEYLSVSHYPSGFEVRYLRTSLKRARHTVSPVKKLPLFKAFNPAISLRTRLRASIFVRLHEGLVASIKTGSTFVQSARAASPKVNETISP